MPDRPWEMHENQTECAIAKCTEKGNITHHVYDGMDISLQEQYNRPKHSETTHS